MKHFFWIVGLAMATLFVACNKNDYNEQDQIRIDNQKIEEYFTAKNITGFTKDPAGFYYKVIEPGTGATIIDSCEINYGYRSTLVGSETNIEKVDSAVNYVFTIIRGLRLSFPKVKIGGKIQVYVPSPLAFGQTGNAKYPGKTPLFFELEAKKLVSSFNKETQIAIEDVAIQKYITDNKLTDSLTKDPKGYYYQIKDPGTGAAISATSTVTVNYTGKLFSGSTFDSGTGKEFGLSGLIEGWKLAIPKLKVGGEIYMILPSPYAYGQYGAGSIPRNTPLIFTVKVTNAK
ncbi:FKBP-type peptidyl-prolyl cis-trans isomerase [Chitinophaga skermanii]|uniref:Peptidyl-prolyl cis-trans isomerase n=1 Tax=Chitinophaga skermanii TaxID=331697 RepID=A0A327QF75_9BACT|nr:FKBP-type peptidyl-prolyl cis-trans isomerase [Chitinophaga skermanii]RAJ02272.1 FKBP-type peptidyl-prolyl cis-trans isomerase [Chitinophaga skermanii]